MGGSGRSGRGHYYAIRGPDFVVEYDNTQNGANHIHAVWRDLGNDWGEDLLADAPRRCPRRETMSYDALVIGLGAHGSAAALALARRGLRVLGLERFERGHGLGSSGGRTRIIRLAYFEDPSYVPLAVASWDRWLELEQEAGASILTPTGGLYGGLPGSDGARRSDPECPPSTTCRTRCSTPTRSAVAGRLRAAGRRRRP